MQQVKLPVVKKVSNKVDKPLLTVAKPTREHIDSNEPEVEVTKEKDGMKSEIEQLKSQLEQV